MRGLQILVVILAGVMPALAQTAGLADWRSAGDLGVLDGFLHDNPDNAEAAALRAKLATQAQGLVLVPLQAAEGYAAQRELLNKANASGQAADYQALLDGFPDGIYAAFAKAALAKLPPPAPPAPDDAARDDAASLVGITFTTPFPLGDQIAGQSMQDLLANASPLFTPIEGIPEEMWKGQHCANCHQWTQAALCDQAKIYITGTDAIPDNAHPLGPVFRKGLREWAKAGCK